jgi:hypothetical protein
MMGMEGDTDTPGAGRDPGEALATIEQAAGEVARAPSPAEGQDAVRRLLDAVYEVGLRARRDPAFRDSPELRGVVARTAPLLERAINVLGWWLMVLEGRFYGTWEWDWDAATRARSALEFLFELYRGTPLAQSFEDLGTGEVDGQLRHVAEYEGMNPDSSVPAGIPASHWWWWAPDAPPAYRET